MDVRPMMIMTILDQNSFLLLKWHFGAKKWKNHKKWNFPWNLNTFLPIFAKRVSFRSRDSGCQNTGEISWASGEWVFPEGWEAALFNLKILLYINKLHLRFCSVARRPPASEEVGRVARFQPPTKMVVAQFWIFRGIAGTFKATFYGSSEILHCNRLGDLLLTSGTD